MNDETMCRCPMKPGFHPGSAAGGSATEDRLIEKWSREHAHHPYARARGALAEAMQRAEAQVGGECMWQMAQEIAGLR
jgi:hypothetical protein